MGRLESDEKQFGTQLNGKKEPECKFWKYFCSKMELQKESREEWVRRLLGHLESSRI